MTPTTVELSEVQRLVGTDLGRSEWLRLEQDRLARFCLATGETPSGRVPSMLLVSVAVGLRYELLHVDGVRTTINYGLDTLRVHARVDVGERVRLHAVVEEAIEVPGGVHLVIAYELEGAEARPALSWRGIQRLLR